jgi:putative two-component system response regulator
MADCGVLLADGDDARRPRLRATLANAGYPCVTAADARSAFELLDGDDKIRVVVCDAALETTSGELLVRAIAQDFPETGMVITAAPGMAAGAALAGAVGASAYLVEPFEEVELLVAVAGALRRAELELDGRLEVQGAARNLGRVQALNGVITLLQSDAAGDAETIERLARAISLRDEETGLHLQRMGMYSALLGAAIGLDAERCEGLRIAAALHDVGKIGVPDAILLKPGPLSAPEYAVMQRHAQLGFQLLAGSGSPLLRTAAIIALGHHEHWDGGGYPAAIHGTQIPLEARIAGVADVFDALTSHRVYRPARSLDETVGIMTDGRGRQFDPAVFDAFLGSLPDVDTIRTTYPDTDELRRIRVLVVDDHEIFSQSLVRLLESNPDMKVIGTAPTVADAERAAIAYEPDVVLMDFELPDGDGTEATRAIKAVRPSTSVVMLTGRADRSSFSRAIAAGCSGFVTKTEPVAVLVQAIRAADAGEEPAPVQGLLELLSDLPPSRTGLGSDLHPRELEVLGLLAAGVPNRLIAEQLHISFNTVRNHVQRILDKLHAHSKLEAVSIAVREGIIDPGT